MKSIAKALYIINKEAKIDEDKKDFYYNIKDKIIDKLKKNHSLKYLGWVIGWRYDGDITYLECYKMCGISFHTPTTIKPIGRRMKPLGLISREVDINKGGKMSVSQAKGILKKFLNN